jgi:hypothetical protein
MTGQRDAAAVVVKRSKRRGARERAMSEGKGVGVVS